MILFGDFFQGPMMPKMPQMDLIAELKKRQVKPQVREGKDGALEDIITGRVTRCFLVESHRDILSTCAACSMFCKLLKGSLLCVRSEEHTIQADRWSTDSASPGHLRHLWPETNLTGITLKHTNKITSFKRFCIYNIKT